MADGSRRFPSPRRADKIPGGYVVRDANGQALAHAYSRDNEAEVQWVALNSRNNSSNEPTRLAHINNHNERALLAERNPGLVQIVWHGALRRLIAAPTGSA